MKRNSNNSHFIYADRKIIEEGVNENMSISQIAYNMKRNKSSILREIDRNKTYIFPSTFNNSHPCIKHKNCPVKEFNCFENCKNIEINLCPKLISSPHICNACRTKSGCRYVKIYYKAYEANNKYLNAWSNDRTGLRYSEDELIVLNTDFYILVINTRSIYHSLLVINNRGYNFKEKSIYRQIKDDQLRVKSKDLPRNRKVKKKQVDTEYKNKESIEGHMYDDYEKYKKENKDAIETQMDTVIGIINANDPVILTLEIVEISFMFIFKLNRKTFEETLKKLQEFENNITSETFNKIMEILLTDNGSEFKNLSTIIEIFPNINIFYCHPYSSFEKGNIENNHEFIRRVIPKNISLKPYTQEDYNLLSSHINSLYRRKLDGKCPFDLINDYIPIDVLNKMGLKKIADKDVNLTPHLLGNKNIENIKKYLDYNDIKKANISITKKEDN